MKGFRFLAMVTVLSILLALSAGLTVAQGPAPQGPGSPQAMVGSTFTYQGQLKKDGNPVNDTCEMVFSLYDDVSAGTQVGGPLTLTVAIADGLFTVPLDFGSDNFTGDARWLEIAVRCTGDAGFNTLAPRQALTAAPYALSLQPGATISGTLGMGNVLTAINNTTNDFAVGVYGESASDFWGFGVFGSAPATSGWAAGVYGWTASPNGVGVYARAPAEGILGQASADTGTTYGVYGRADSVDGRGVMGYASATDGTTYGVYGEAVSASGYGVYGYAPNIGTVGWATATSGGTSGVYGRVDSTEGRAVAGWATAGSGATRGVYGRSDSTDGTGVRGLANAASGVTYGVLGQANSTDGYGLYGSAPVCGVYGRADSTTGLSHGVYGEAYGLGTGVYGTGPAYGVEGWSTGENGRGVLGYSEATTGSGVGVYGVSLASNGYAGYFVGAVQVVGDFSVSGNKAFKIDHPLDPANKYLYHYSVESAEVLDQYSGNAVLGADGSAWVDLPAWFSAINQDVRYQLTPVGGAAPGLYIAQEVRDNRFQIAGGPPGLKVSWLITALRSDPYIQRHGAPVEVEKPAAERGTYLFPELYGQPAELGRDYQFTVGRPAAAGPEAPALEEVP